MTRKHFSQRERVRLFTLNGGKCYLCDMPIKVGEVWQVEHVIPWELTREALAAKYRSQSTHSHKRVETALAIKAATTAELQEHVMLENMAREIQEAVEFEPMLGDVAFLKDMGLA